MLRVLVHQQLVMVSVARVRQVGRELSVMKLMNVLQTHASKVHVQQLMMATHVSATLVGEEMIATRVHVNHHLAATTAHAGRMIQLQ